MLHPRTIANLSLSVWVLAGFCLCIGAAAQEAAPNVLSQECTFEVLKATKAEKLNLSRWGSAAGTPFGGLWRTNLEGPASGQDWLILNGKLDCRPGFPLEGTRLVDDSSGVFPAMAYSGTCAEIEKDEFNVIEGSPGTGRIEGGKMVWAVMPDKKTGVRTIYLSDDLYKPGPPDLGLCLVFGVPKAAQKLDLRIGERAPISVAVGK